MSVSSGIAYIILYIFIVLAGLKSLQRAFSARTSGQSKDAVSQQKLVLSDDYHHSCTHCQDLTITLPHGWPLKVPNVRIRLPHSVLDVCEAAADGCQLFKDVHNASTIPLVNRIILHTQVLVSTFSAKSPLHAFTGYETLKDRVVYFFRSLSNRPFHIRVGRLEHDAGGTLYVRFLYSAWHSFEIDLSADADDHAAQYVSERPLNFEVVAEYTFARARQWLEECSSGHSSHPQCLLERSTFIPTRLIEIRHHPDGSFIPRIYHSEKGEQIAWACLSYCWGGDQPIKTTRARLNERVSLLPFTDLPGTLRDAIIVADRIGLRFLWIDALCIIQDDPDDVAREISMMPNIYKYCACTISASRASSSEEGFLQIHETEAMHQKPIKVRVKCPDGKLGFVKLAYRGTEYRYGIEPIHKRAWCFQERLLSTRLLDFERTQLRWTCLSKVDVDGGKANLAAATDRLIGRSLQHLTRPQLDELWQDTVTAYARRDLTFAGDRLLAISAVASEFAPSFKDDYLAGFWRRSLAHQLVWMAGRPRKARHQSYIAPSWSWAAAPDRVYWDVYTDDGSAVDVIDCQVQLSHPHAPFGSVIGGFILLKGQMREVTWYYNRGEIHMRTGTEFFTFTSKRDALEATQGHGQDTFLGWPVADALEEEWLQDPDYAMTVHCLKVWERNEKRGTRCLLLLPASKARTSYKRIGSFAIGDARYRYDPPIERNFFEDIEPEEIKII